MDETAASRAGAAERSDRAALGYALLFSVPVLLGVTVMMLKVTGGRPLSLVVAPGVVVGVAVFALVLLGARGGDPGA
jgi:hypothetical protein